MVKRIASYLSRLDSTKYGVEDKFSMLINYFIDSYFHKTDERALAAARVRKPDPADLDTDIKEKWLGCEINHTIGIKESYPAYLKAQTAYAFARLFSSNAGGNGAYEIVPFIDSYEYKEILKSSYNYKTQFSQISISEVDEITLPTYGTFFIQRVSDNSLLVVTIDLCNNTNSCEIFVQSAKNSDSSTQFLADLSSSMKFNDIYRNKCLSYESGILNFQKIRSTSWDDVIINPELKERILSNSTNILHNMESLMALNIRPCRNSILISPPGMAKTTIFRAISNDLNGVVTRIWCTGKSINYAEHVEALFSAARSLSPCIIFIEDMDLFGGERIASHDNHILNEFLAQLDGTYDNSGVVVMASTNDFESMDEALINRPGRFNDKIVIPIPNDIERAAMLKKFLNSHNARKDQSVTADVLDQLIKLTDGFTGDYIKEVINSAVLLAVSAGRFTESNLIITADDLIQAGLRSIENYKIGKKAKKHIRNDEPELGA